MQRAPLPHQCCSWGMPGAHSTAAAATGAPMHWRCRRQNLAAAAGNPQAAYDVQGSFGAFVGLRVVFFGSSDAPPFSSLVRMLKAGGGLVLRRSPPYSSCLPDASAPTAGKAVRKKQGETPRKQPKATAAAAAATANLAVIGPDRQDKDSR